LLVVAALVVRGRVDQLLRNADRRGNSHAHGGARDHLLRLGHAFRCFLLRFHRAFLLRSLLLVSCACALFDGRCPSSGRGKRASSRLRSPRLGRDSARRAVRGGRRHLLGRNERGKMANGSENGGQGNGLGRKLLAPAAISLVGSAIGFLLTKRQDLRAAAPKLRNAVSDLPRPHVPERGVGDLADELRGKVDSVLGRDSPSTTSSGSSTRVDHAELQQRRRARQERRDRRRKRSRR